MNEAEFHEIKLRRSKRLSARHVEIHSTFNRNRVVLSERATRINLLLKISLLLSFGEGSRGDKFNGNEEII